MEVRSAAREANGHELPSGTVTFVFTDIEGSTTLLRRLGRGYEDVLNKHRDIIGSSFEAVGGVVVEVEGDAVFAAFARASDAVAGRPWGAARSRCGCMARGSSGQSSHGHPYGRGVRDRPQRATSGSRCMRMRASPAPLTEARCSSLRQRTT